MERIKRDRHIAKEFFLSSDICNDEYNIDLQYKNGLCLAIQLNVGGFLPETAIKPRGFSAL